jgi:hypothetical protein
MMAAQKPPKPSENQQFFKHQSEDDRKRMEMEKKKEYAIYLQ